jgi:hypothetical protein
MLLVLIRLHYYRTNKKFKISNMKTQTVSKSQKSVPQFWEGADD